ncbi:hypothetical protein QBC47DRAFT_294927 [Echria macrotheca]|uniref:NAD(P)-binding protein n=1 Tax=Echria macrotheca TaxID=438768 RepID=A0AAJ0FCV0_9PEZI|nr:hypothetical protein QBC47DRAFT_294927 [Echria macrotheca]
MDFPTNKDDPAWSLEEKIQQSAPVDLESAYSTASLAGKTILITGAASGFGAAFARRWAALGAHIMAGDVNDAAGEALIAELRSFSPHHHYQRCDVTVWADQVALFKMAAANSPTGRIDAVVAGAGIVDLSGRTFDDPPSGLDGEDPPAPKLAVLGVNLTGVMYTTHLALFWLQKNGFRDEKEEVRRDRHLLLVSSIAGLSPLPGQTEYAVSKHGVVGLFRTLRATSMLRRGVRVNLLCPYFVKTSLLPWQGDVLLAGGALGTVDDVVEAATRLQADEGIVGRGLVIGPKGEVEVEVDDGEMGKTKTERKEGAIWEVYAHDYRRVEVFVWRYVAMLNSVKKVRGWIGTLRDLWGIYRREGGRKKKVAAK